MCDRNGEISASHGALIASMKDDFDRLRADVEDLHLKHKDLLQRTAMCCQSKAQLDAQIHAGINDYLMMACTFLGIDNVCHLSCKRDTCLTTFSGTTWVSRHQKGRTIVDFNEARDDMVAVASAGPYANHLHFAPNSGRQVTMPAPHHSNLLQAGCTS